MPQGIFISYRRDDTRDLAKDVYDALKLAFPKKKIFFDTDIPEPGIDIIEKIERELASCQVVIAIIGPRWNAADRLRDKRDFVRRELKSALDLKRQKKLKVLPVLVGGGAIARRDLPEDIEDLSELEYLDLGNDGSVQRLVERIRGLLPAYWIGNSDDVERWGGDFVDLLQQLIKLDIDEVPTIDVKPRNPLRRLYLESRRMLERFGFYASDPGDEGTPEQWALIFERHPQTWRMILDRNDDIIAYWHVAPLNDQDYRKLLAGRFKAGMVTYDKLTLFESKSGIYNLFFVITVIAERHRTNAVRRQLFYSFFDVLDKLAGAEQPVFISEVAADVWTDEGIKLAEGFGMRRVGRRADNRKILIYTVPVTDVLNDYIARREYPALRERYIEAGFVLDKAAKPSRTTRVSAA
jgi:hypothetical protein